LLLTGGNGMTAGACQRLVWQAKLLLKSELLQLLGLL
jgi:hypothetical protein